MADLVNPMEVFAAMNASLLEKQPKAFNPIYTIRPTPIKPLKIGGKPPREVFYRDTLTFMTSLPPAVQPKLCSCKYLCNGDPASIICHSCSIYDPTKSAYYCTRCFPTRHPWYRVPHLFTKIENDESIAHTLKIAHRVAEATRYDNEGKSILRKVRNQKPNLVIVADDEKVDNQLRVYGRKVVALEERVLEMRERLQRDIMFGDVVPMRRSLYSKDENEDEEDKAASNRPHSLSVDDDNDEEDDPTIFGERVMVSEDSTGAVPSLRDLRGSSMFISEPLFVALEEDEDTPESSEVNQQQLHQTRARRTSKPQIFVRAPFVRVDTAESTDSMTISPFSENGGFFRDDSYTNPLKNTSVQQPPPLQSIVEADIIINDGDSSKLGSPAGVQSPSVNQQPPSPAAFSSTSTSTGWHAGRGYRRSTGWVWHWGTSGCLGGGTSGWYTCRNGGWCRRGCGRSNGRGRCGGRWHRRVWSCIEREKEKKRNMNRCIIFFIYETIFVL